MEYFISIRNEKCGPYSLDELKARGIKAETLVLAVGTDRWVPAWQVDELRKLLMEPAQEQPKADEPFKEETVAESPIEEPPFVEAQPIETPQPPKQVKKKGGRGCLLTTLLILIALVCALVLTCPSSSDHKASIAQVAATCVNEMSNSSATTSDDGFVVKTMRIVGNTFTRQIVEAVVNNLVTVDNYAVCSVGKINYEGKEHIVSVGVLGHVFTVDKEYLRHAADKYYMEAEKKMERSLEEQIQQNLIDPVSDAVQQMIKETVGSIFDAPVSDPFGSEEQDSI